MLKKLDILVIKAFIGPFIATFFITLLVLVMQFFWLYIDDFVGKGINTATIFEFIFYQSAALVPMALPLAVLLSSLMTFGNLGESYELVAIKSSGISLLRFMQPLFLLSCVIAGLAFLFSNYTIPVANLKSRTLLSDIVYTKPSFDIKEGVFYDKLSGFAIKIGKKEKNDSVIRDIIIYEQGNGVQDNFIIATDGIMRISDNKRYLEFHLKNGWRYEERANNPAQSEFIRLGFKEYKKSFDLSSFGFKNRTADSLNKGIAQMLSMRQLNKAIDSLSRNNALFAGKVKNEVLSTAQVVTYLDSNWRTTSAKNLKAKSFDSLIPDSIKGFVEPRLSSKISIMKASNEALLLQYKEQQRKLRVHQIEWHRKISYSLACVVLFLIGAPLGSIIRKGGIGSPLVFAIVFFMLFFFTNSSGEKFAKEGEWSPLMGMWFSTMVLLPIAFFLIYKALHDSQLFNKEFYYRLYNKLPFRKKKQVHTS